MGRFTQTTNPPSDMKNFVLILWVMIFFTLPVFSNENTAQLNNLSYRGKVGTGEKVAIAGFVIVDCDRQTDSGLKRVLIRAIGPSFSMLRPLVVENPLTDPELYLYRGNELVAYNGNWVGTAETQSAMRNVGAFELESNSKDAVIIAELPPGAYTAVMAVQSGESGQGLVEVYDLSPHVGGEFVNFSVRGRVNGRFTGSAAFVGYSFIGNGEVTIFTRAVGPGLADFGVEKYLAEPLLSVVSGAGKPLGGNFLWSHSDVQIAQAVGAFPLPLMSRNPGFTVNFMLENGKNMADGSSSLVTQVQERSLSEQEYNSQDLNDLVLIEVYKVP